MIEHTRSSARNAKVVPLDARFRIEPFDIEFVHLTHSIPEPMALAIRTRAGTVFHTGDWKIDPTPLVGGDMEIDKLAKLGDGGVLAVIGDSTNAMREGEAGSEAEVRTALTALFAAGIALAFAPSIYVLATTNDLKSLEPAASEFLVLHKRLWPAAILSFIGVFLYVILLSHRIAGPMYRIDAILRALLEDREPPVVKFRDNDFFQPTAKLLEELSDKMRASRGSAPTRPGAPSGPSAS